MDFVANSIAGFSIQSIKLFTDQDGVSYDTQEEVQKCTCERKPYMKIANDGGFNQRIFQSQRNQRPLPFILWYYSCWQRQMWCISKRRGEQNYSNGKYFNGAQPGRDVIWYIAAAANYLLTSHSNINQVHFHQHQQQQDIHMTCQTHRHHPITAKS